MFWQPTTDFRWTLKKGMQGDDVGALQLNLPNLVVDGDYGRMTRRAVWRFQADHGLEVDGIAGIVTQQKLCVSLSTPAARAEGEPARPGSKAE